MPAPPFGTASAYTDSFPSPPPRQVTISSETCFNLSLFKDMLKQYRRLDDQIITRLNRAQAQLRDTTRHASSPPSTASSSSWWHSSASSSSSSNNANDAMCLQIWDEIMSGWAHRQTMLSYCITAVDRSVLEKKPVEENVQFVPFSRYGQEVGMERERGWKEEEVMADQLRNEEAIEAIIRKRTLDAFKSRCQYFALPAPGSAAREWWDLAESGRAGRGPDLP
ncbi:caffeine-induced death protein 2-domain-containing protein [Naematelia encephala]|uniref:Caffeine-induced death protein 2-domain-containing protein n=1 Tax=Naematelia encephala TaxID=71784 RepID=A0A1Y2AZN3_9TREE|nr:caffeine-induced death protein 2-domain-containing protein [Naematelia encephala]